MNEKAINSGWYLLCKYGKGQFSCERVVYFSAFSAGDSIDFSNGRGIVLGYQGNMLKQDENGNYSALKENSIKGEGLIKCVFIGEPKKGRINIGISNQHGHRVSQFIVPRDSIQYIR